MSLLTHVPFKKIDVAEDACADGSGQKSNPISSFIKEVDFDAYEKQLAMLTAEMHKTAEASTQPVGANRKILARIVGFQDSLEKLRMILASARINSARIEGPRGIGKTSLVDALLRLRAQRRMGSRIMAKPAFIMDVSTFFKLGDGDWVDQFEKAMRYVSEHKGFLVIDHFDDFVHMADGKAARLVNTLVAALENNDEMQAIIITESDHAERVREVATGLERRFEKLVVQKEADSTRLKQILMAQAPTLERHHNVDISEEAVDEIIRLLERYPGRAFNMPRPKNAVTFADRAAAYVRLTQYSEPPEVTLLREEVAVLIDQVALLSDEERKAHQAVVDELGKRKEEFESKDKAWRTKFAPVFTMQKNIAQEEAIINRFERKSRSRQEDEVYGKAKKNRDECQQKLAEIERQLSPKPPVVTALHVRKVFSDESGVPLSNLSQDKLKRLSQLRSVLDGQIFKQNSAKNALEKVYTARELGVCDPCRPAGVLIFLGGTGLGKSELVKVLVRFDSGEGTEPVIIRLSEFPDKTSVKKLIGADPGLVGYDEGAKYLEPIRANSRAIVLLDEADKAHPAMFDMLMQAFEDGVITTSQGTKVPLKDVIFVMAMNGVTASNFKRPEDMRNDELVREKLSQLEFSPGQGLFRPEFLGRVDEVVVFENLDVSDDVKIFRKEVVKLNIDYRDRGLTVDPDDEETNTRIVERYRVPVLGGRSARAIMKKYIRPLLTAYAMERALKAEGQDVAKEKVSLHMDENGAISLKTPKGVYRPEPEPVVVMSSSTLQAA
jgi:ATP-dependent Clp protease ATP-binding subunit ClpB